MLVADGTGPLCADEPRWDHVRALDPSESNHSKAQCTWDRRTYPADEALGLFGDCGVCPVLAAVPTTAC